MAAAVLSGGLDLTTKAVTLHNPIAQQLRDQLLSFLSGINLIQQRVTPGVSELGVNYRKSPIVAEDRLAIPQFHLLPHPSFDASPLDYLNFGSAPHAGDRTPDVVLNAAESKHLFDVLKGTHYTLLLFPGVKPTQGVYLTLGTVRTAIQARYHHWITPYLIVPPGVTTAELEGQDALLRDTEGALHDRYGAGSECLYLIRPDGYIGYRSQPVEVDRLLSYLKRLFV